MSCITSYHCTRLGALQEGFTESFEYTIHGRVPDFGGADDGGFAVAERRRRVVTLIATKNPTSPAAGVDDFFKMYSSYETELVWDVSMDRMVGRRPATLGELLSEGQRMWIDVRYFKRGNGLMENYTREVLQRIAGLYMTEDDVGVGNIERDVSNIHRIDPQTGVDNQVHTETERIQTYLLKNHLRGIRGRRSLLRANSL